MSLGMNAMWVQDDVKRPWDSSSSFPVDKQRCLTAHRAETISMLKEHNIRFVFAQVGMMDSSGSISYKHSDAEFTDIIDDFHAEGIKVLAWFEVQSGVYLNVVAMRQTLINTALATVAKGFDGWCDDVERFSNGETEKIAYWNALTDALHGAGKLHIPTVAEQIVARNRNHLLADAVAAMCYGNETFLKETWFAKDWALLLQAVSPVVAGLLNSPRSTWTLAQNIDAVNRLSGRPAGFCVYLYEWMDANDWAAWDALVGNGEEEVTYLAKVTNEGTGTMKLVDMVPRTVIDEVEVARLEAGESKEVDLSTVKDLRLRPAD